MNSLTELKKIIQSINNKITDDNIKALQKQILQQGRLGKKDPVVTLFLKMMQSLGKYLGARKNKAHKDSLPVLNSITDQLDTYVSQGNFGEDEANRILSEEIKKYKHLKNQIASKPPIHENDINNLKSVILAMDWEISTTTVQSFEKVVTSLLKKFKNYKIHHTFLKIIHSTGRYIGIQKANAHTDSISFLRSVFENFEQLIQTHDMTFKDKQKILETNIKRFYEFKRKLSLKTKSPQPPAEVAEDESPAPALSHVKKTSTRTPGDMIPLTKLPPQEDILTGKAPNLDKTAPGVSPQDPSTPGPRDVMDDLFNLKDSPADELLDAIHLMDVHGSDKDQNLLDQANTLQSREIKNFTSQKMGSDPIPEIESRLDEFFNLDVSPDNGVTPHDTNDPATGVHTIDEDRLTDGTLPLKNENEDIRTDLHKTDNDEALPHDIDSAILNRLRATIEDSEWLRYEASMLSIKEDISYLEKHWQNNPEKACLIQIIALIINQLEHPGKSIQKKNKPLSDESEQGVSDTPQKKPLGIWGKTKGIFTS